MSKILITGGTGFIGKRLIRHFIEKKDKIIAHGSSKKSLENLRQILTDESIDIKTIEFWEQNFLENNWNFPDFSQIDDIIHCAAATKVREGTLENYDKYFKLNVLATKNLAKKALEEKIKHFIHLSTGQVYGIPSEFPITAKTPKKPINLYGFTKLMGEKIVGSFGIFGLNYTILRPFSVYGKGQENIISIITNKIKNDQILTIFGDGTQSRAFCDVADICNAIQLIMNNPKCFHEEYNLSGEKEYSVNDLVKLISNKFNKEPQIVFEESGVNELKRNIADIRSLKNLGLRPRGSLEEFIESLN